jgi:hypothetical protein
MLILKPVNGTGMKTAAAPFDIVKSVYRKFLSHVSLCHRFAFAEELRRSYKKCRATDRRRSLVTQNVTLAHTLILIHSFIHSEVAMNQCTLGLIPGCDAFPNYSRTQ